ncbi:hypothetical protein [Micromonospora robiginosa]|uniref:LysM domain-containing protein n=1 Tax=Micromonospora robiginosa TaxID=2749844 RepID=A0A7L6B3F5_9ACTN|nr:hypothetical protein [Micromonospora ferruginea]QLQ36446.1 hypothetical protein H1D33_24555 [Micromonospora ferruginea]
MRMRRAVQAVLVLVGIWLAPGAPAHAAPAETGRYYVVGPPVDGQREYLYAIALRTLGNGNRYREIVDLNTGRAQPDGETFTDGLTLNPGWVLVLPRDAKGQGVRIGPLPRVRATPPATRPPAPARSTPTRTTAAPTPARSSTPARSPATAGAAARPPATTEVAAPPRRDRTTGGGIDPLVIRVGAGVLSVLLAVVAIVLLRPGRGGRAPAVAGDDGPWPPHRHHTPPPGAGARTEAEGEAGPPGFRPDTGSPVSALAPEPLATGVRTPSATAAPAGDPPPSTAPGSAPIVRSAGTAVSPPAPTTEAAKPADPAEAAAPTDPAEVARPTDSTEAARPAGPGETAAGSTVSPRTATSTSAAGAATPRSATSGSVTGPGAVTASGPDPATAASVAGPAPSTAALGGADVGATPDVPRPPLPAEDGAPYLTADLDTDVGPARVRLVGVAAGRGAPPYAWLGPGETAPPAMLPLVLGRRGPWRLHVDLARVPDVFTLVGPVALCGRAAVALAGTLSAAGVGVAVVGETPGGDLPAGCRRLPDLPEPPRPGEGLPEPSVVFVEGPPPAGARGLAAATGGRCVPVVLGPVPAGRWSLQLDAEPAAGGGD